MANRILIIDDDLDTLRLVGLMLQRQGYHISAATNGLQGLKKALEERPDLILLDVMMPDMDGYEVTRRLRKNPATSSTPILMFTAKTQLDDKVTGFEVGADDYLTKPTHPTELQAHVKALLARIGPKDTEVMTAPHELHGYVIGVLASRGGLGVSSLASNLAASLFNRTQMDVILAELTPGQGTLGLDLGNYELLVTRLASLARFVVLDLGVGLPQFVQKILPMCDERIVVLEGSPTTIQGARVLIDEIVNLGIDGKGVTTVLNNRVRSEAQMPWTQVQEKLGHSIAITLTPAPELFLQAERMQTLAVLCQPTNVTSQQFLKVADLIIEREKAR